MRTRLLFTVLVLLICHAAAAQERGLVLGGVVIAGVADYGTTMRCIAPERCQEANPVLRWTLARGEWAFAATKAVSIALVAAAVHWLYAQGHRGWARVVGLSATGVWGYAALRNARLSKGY